MDYQKTPEAQEFENQAAVVCYSRMSELGFKADPMRTFIQNLHRFGEWYMKEEDRKFPQKCCTGGCDGPREYCYACYIET